MLTLNGVLVIITVRIVLTDVKLVETLEFLKFVNQERAEQGTNPVTQDPTVQFIAEKREQQVANNDYAQGNPHIAPDGSLQFQNVINKYNLPATDDWGENVEIGVDGNYTKPSDLARHENNSWDSAHKATRDNPTYTKAGVAIKNGVVVEDFE